VSGTRSRQLGQTRTRSLGKPGRFFGRGTTDQRCGGLLMISRSGRGHHGLAETSRRGFARPQLLTWYHAPRRSGRSMSARSRAQYAWVSLPSSCQVHSNPRSRMDHSVIVPWVLGGSRCADQMRTRRDACHNNIAPGVLCLGTSGW